MDIPSNQTFSGSTYHAGNQLHYDNPDVQFITGIAEDSNNYLGPVLTDLDSIGWGGVGYPEYTPNYDLFIFEYDNDDTNIHINSMYLNNYIQNLRNIGKIAPYQGSIVPVAIIAHSMGGLVARYFVENLDEQTDGDIDINSLITIGTPHFGSWSLHLKDILLDPRNRSTQ
jgi:pimeloyl-ACP methyl ester carboxylesterase